MQYKFPLLVARTLTPMRFQLCLVGTCMLVTFGIPGCKDSAKPRQNNPQPSQANNSQATELPQAVIGPWQQRGAELGWYGTSTIQGSGLSFNRDRRLLSDDAVRAFSFSNSEGPVMVR